MFALVPTDGSHTCIGCDSVPSVRSGCTYLFTFPVSRIRISVKFRKVPRENETDAKAWLDKKYRTAGLFILLLLSHPNPCYVIKVLGFSNLCCVAFVRELILRYMFCLVLKNSDCYHAQHC